MQGDTVSLVPYFDTSVVEVTLSAGNWTKVASNNPRRIYLGFHYNGASYFLWPGVPSFTGRGIRVDNTITKQEFMFAYHGALVCQEWYAFFIGGNSPIVVESIWKPIR